EKSRVLERIVRRPRKVRARAEREIKSELPDQPNRLRRVVQTRSSIRIRECADRLADPLLEAPLVLGDFASLYVGRGRREDRVVRGVRANFEGVPSRDRSDVIRSEKRLWIVIRRWHARRGGRFPLRVADAFERLDGRLASSPRDGIEPQQPARARGLGTDKNRGRQPETTKHGAAKRQHGPIAIIEGDEQRSI